MYVYVIQTEYSAICTSLQSFLALRVLSHYTVCTSNIYLVCQTMIAIKIDNTAAPINTRTHFFLRNLV